MPGAGHAHSERFERCLGHLKYQGADPGKAHRICYTSVGKGENEDGGYTEDDLKKDCEYCTAIRKLYVVKGCPEIPSVLEDLLNIEIITKSDNRHIGGWASVEVKDKQGELIDIDAFTDDMLKWFVENTPLIHIQHLDIPIGKVSLIEKRTRADGKRGLWVEADLFSKYTIHDAAWRGFEEGRLRGFSIRGRALEKGRECVANLCYAYVPSIELYGISAVESPANPLSTGGPMGFSSKASDSMSESIRQVTRSLLTKQEPPVKEPDRNEPTDTPTSGGEVPKKPEANEKQPEKTVAPGDYVGREEFAALVEAVKKLAPGTQEAARTTAAMAEEIGEKSPPPQMEPEKEPEMPPEEEKKPESQADEVKSLKKQLAEVRKMQMKPVYRSRATPVAPTTRTGNHPLIDRVREALSKGMAMEANPFDMLGFKGHPWRGGHIDRTFTKAQDDSRQAEEIARLVQKRIQANSAFKKE